MPRKIKVNRHVVAVSNEDKILFPKSKITKGDIIDYYKSIASIMIPHMKNRPISMQRFPKGIDHEGFFQKDAGDYFPKWITRIGIPKQEDGIVNYVVVNEAATLVYLANQACIVMHTWLSKKDKLDFPDRMIFDLDPSKGVTFALVQWAARELKKVLDQLALPSFVMTTGSRGVHVVIPLKRVHTFDETRAFAHDIAQLLAAQYDKKITTDIHKKKRGKRIFIDWLRNAFGQTGVAPYSVRALEGAPIATPIEWNELFKKGMTPQYFTIKNIWKRMSKREDPWKNMSKSAVSLRKVRVSLENLMDLHL